MPHLLHVEADPGNPHLLIPGWRAWEFRRPSVLFSEVVRVIAFGDERPVCYCTGYPLWDCGHVLALIRAGYIDGPEPARAAGGAS